MNPHKASVIAVLAREKSAYRAKLKRIRAARRSGELKPEQADRLVFFLNGQLVAARFLEKEIKCAFRRALG